MIKMILFISTFLVLLGCETAHDRYEANPAIKEMKEHLKILSNEMRKSNDLNDEKLTIDYDRPPNEATVDSAFSYDMSQNIPTDFQGENLADLIEKIKQIKNSPQDEFKKTSEKQFDLSSLINKSYRFIIPQDKNTISSYKLKKGDFGKDISGVRYDADAEVMKVNLWVGESRFGINLSEHGKNHYGDVDTTTIKVVDGKFSTNEFIGQNTYGATATIRSYKSNDYGLAIANVKPQHDDPLFSYAFSIKPNEAKAIKSDLFFYVDVNITSSVDYEGIILEDVLVKTATISSPSEYYSTKEFLLVNIKEAGIFRKSSGEVLRCKRF